MDINVCIACDENYAPHAAALIASIMVNKAPEDRIILFILSDKISEATKRKFVKMSELWSYSLKIIDLDDAMFHGLPKWGGSYAAYFRLCIGQLLPPKITKILYLDCDMIVTESLAPLFKTNIDEKYGAVVAEGDTVRSFYSYMKFPSRLYFNTGMILFNVDKYRKDGMKEKILARARELRDVVKMPDQDLLNEAFAENVVRVPLQWNLVMSRARYDEYITLGLGNCHSEREIAEAMADPAIIHFNTGAAPRPWQAGSRHERKNDYWKHLRLTPFYSRVRLKYFHSLLRKGIKRLGDGLLYVRWRKEKRTIRLCGVTLYTTR